MVVELPLTRGLTAKLHPVDAMFAEAHAWRAVARNSRNGGWYVTGRVDGEDVYLHRYLMGALPGEIVDHVDGDGLNNTPENLRFCSDSQNKMNRCATSSSGFKNVHTAGFHADGVAVWRVGLKLSSGKVIHGGVFRCKKAAALRANELMIEHFGEFAKLNEVSA